MELIDRDELRLKFDGDDDVKLVMALGGWAFQAKRIPGSLSVTSLDQAKAKLAPDDEIVVYCSGLGCAASPFAYRILTMNGYTNVRRYEGGVADWEAAGLPLEGDAVGPPTRAA